MFQKAPLGKILIRRGEAKGRAEGEAKVLLRQLTKRFGTPPEETTSRILSAKPEQLERGTDAFLDAKSPSDVLHAVFAG